MKILLALPVLLAGCGSATIGGTEVPDDLHCEEDEVIAFVWEGQPPYDLGCVHPSDLYIDIGEADRHERVSR